MAYDVRRIRSWFPALEYGWAQFDGPGGTQTPRQVGEAVASVLTGPLSNRGLIGESEVRAEEAVTSFRLAVADLVNAHPRGVVHGRSATQLVYDFSRHLSRGWGAGDGTRPAPHQFGGHEPTGGWGGNGGNGGWGGNGGGYFRGIDANGAQNLPGANGNPNAGQNGGVQLIPGQNGGNNGGFGRGGAGAGRGEGGGGSRFDGI